MKRAAILMLTVAALAVGAAMAQEKDAGPAGGCEPGFSKYAYPHGSAHNFRCRTRVINCPEWPGQQVVVILEPGFEVAAGAQFGYRCQYHSWDR